MEELRIKTILKLKRLTMKDLSLKLGINRVSLSVSLSKNPTLDSLRKIAKVLGVELYELFERKEKGIPEVSGYLEVRDKGITKIECFEDLEKIYLELTSISNKDSYNTIK